MRHGAAVVRIIGAISHAFSQVTSAGDENRTRVLSLGKSSSPKRRTLANQSGRSAMRRTMADPHEWARMRHDAGVSVKKRRPVWSDGEAFWGHVDMKFDP